MEAVTIKRPAELKAKLDRLVEGGVSTLHIIADFDSTLTDPAAETSWGCLRRSKDLSEAFHETSARLYKRFHAVEIDERVSITERAQAMNEWWELAHGALLAENVTRQVFRDMVKDREAFFFRSRTRELVALAAQHQVPFLIFSAGLGDLIDAAVERENWGASVHVISNHLEFDAADGVARRFRHHNIHTFSKKEAVLPELHEDWAREVMPEGAHRKHVILLGDSIGDIHMAEGIAHDEVLKIGFLNAGQESSLAEYSEAFDVVLYDDHSMDYVIQVLQQILKGAK